METAAIVLDYIKVLIWPGVVGTALIVYRTKIHTALGRLTALEAFGMKASLETAVDQAEALATEPPGKPMPAPAKKSRPQTADRLYLSPKKYSDLRPFATEYRNGRTIMLDLKSMTHDEAKRAVDFAAGMIFHARGDIERIDDLKFLVTPPKDSEIR